MDAQLVAQPSREEMLRKTNSTLRALGRVVQIAKTRHRRVEEEVAVRYGFACRSDIAEAEVKP